jgi:hypothetical protein
MAWNAKIMEMLWDSSVPVNVTVRKATVVLTVKSLTNAMLKTFQNVV